MLELINGIKIFMTGCMKFNPVIRVWLFILLSFNIVGPLFFIEHDIAILTLSCALSGALLGFILSHLHGFKKILGLMHVPWIPMVIMQVVALIKLSPSKDHFYIWLLGSFIVSTISILIDIFDVYTFFRSKR